MSALHSKVRAREGGVLSERGCGAHRAEVGCEACQLVSCSWGEGIDGTRGLHDQQWCWV